MKLINDDCINVMQDYTDNYFDLAIVDPPYGKNLTEKVRMVVRVNIIKIKIKFYIREYPMGYKAKQKLFS